MKRFTLTSALAAALSSAKEVAASGQDAMVELMAGARRFLQSVWMRTTKRRRGISAMTTSRARGRSQKGRVRLGRARGPGSINAKADGLYLARIGQWQEAADMLYDADPELSVRYRRYAKDDQLIPHDLANLSAAHPLTTRFVP